MKHGKQERRGDRRAEKTQRLPAVTGILHFKLPRGAWLAPDEPPGAESIQLRESDCLNLIPGDRLLVLPQEGRPGWGRVLRLVGRRRTQLVGTLRRGEDGRGLVAPRDPHFRMEIALEDPPESLEGHWGRLVSVKLRAPAAGEARPGAPTGVFSRDLGAAQTAGNDISTILADYGGSQEFSAPVLEASRGVPAWRGGVGVTAEQLDGRTDLRSLEVVTIDPADAQDNDDAVSVEPLEGGGWRLGVHIADVAAFVAPGSTIDQDARARGNSAYLVDRPIRMLPEDLTTRVCSLRADEDHLAHSVLMEVSAAGEITSARTCRSVVRSRACLSYDEVQAHIDGGRRLPAELARAVDALLGCAQALRRRRHELGMLEFSVPEVCCELGKDGEPVAFHRRSARLAYILIEECMLAANRMVAEKVSAAGVPAIYRVHPGPNAEQWRHMERDLAALGFSKPPRQGARMFRFFGDILGSDIEEIATLAVLRNVPRAVYSAKRGRHFGLNFDIYAHFTSPIRRYPDLVLHRILTALENGAPPPYSEAEIAELARHCGDTEREAAEMEAQSMQIKRYRYYAARLERGERGPWEGMVTGMNRNGFMVELPDTLLSGLLPFGAFGGKLDARAVLDGGWEASPLKLGQKIRVCLARADERTQRVDFGLPGAPKAQAERRETGDGRRVEREASGDARGGKRGGRRVKGPHHGGGKRRRGRR